MSLKCAMILGDCLEVMPTLAKGWADFVYADLPYSLPKRLATNNKWDKPIDLLEYKRAIRTTSKTSAMVCASANDTFAAQIACAFPDLFRYTLVWEKIISGLYYHANKRPLLRHEFVQILGRPGGTYNPIKCPGRPYTSEGAGANKNMRSEGKRQSTINAGERLPSTIISIPPEKTVRIHPTQKPVGLLTWLIRTYSNPDEQVLDPVSGSATTAVSALQNGRHVTCIEKDAGYFDAGLERVRRHVSDNAIDATIEVRR